MARHFGPHLLHSGHAGVQEIYALSAAPAAPAAFQAVYSFHPRPSFPRRKPSSVASEYYSIRGYANSVDVNRSDEQNFHDGDFRRKPVPEGIRHKNQGVARGTGLFSRGLRGQVRRSPDFYGNDRTWREQPELPEHLEGCEQPRFNLGRALSGYRGQGRSTASIGGDFQIGKSHKRIKARPRMRRGSRSEKQLARLNIAANGFSVLGRCENGMYLKMFWIEGAQSLCLRLVFIMNSSQCIEFSIS